MDIKYNPNFNRKQYHQEFKSGAGFTLIELMVSISVMALVLTIVITNLGGRKPNRDIKIAQNELVTNIKKTQSYSLSSHKLPNGKAAQYFLLKLDITNQQYVIQGIYDLNTGPKLIDIETIKFPKGIQFAATVPLTINNVSATQPCVLLAFKLPFAKAIINDGCNFNSFNNDDYRNLIDAKPPRATVDGLLNIKLSDQSGSLTNRVIVNGITGLVSFQ